MWSRFARQLLNTGAERTVGYYLPSSSITAVLSRHEASIQLKFRLISTLPGPLSSSGSTDASAAGSTPISASGPHAASLKSRSVVRFDGPEVIKFLQGLLTNDVSKFQRPAASEDIPLPTPNQPAKALSPIYSALLTPQGRFLFDMFLYQTPKREERLNRYGSGPGSSEGEEAGLLADVDSNTVDELLSVLKKHRLRANVRFEDISSELAVWTQFGGALAHDGENDGVGGAGGVGYGGTDEHAGKVAAEGTDEGWQWFVDPRLQALGLRGLFPKGMNPPLVEADKETVEEHFKIWRYELGVPEGPVEIPRGEAIPLEYNLEGLSGVSFEKGCYVGQELISRTHNLGVIRKRVMSIQFVNPDDPHKEAQKAAVPGDNIIDASTKKKVGKVTAALGPRGLALLRLEAALKGNGTVLQIEGQGGALVLPKRPLWWPQEWGHEV